MEHLCSFDRSQLYSDEGRPIGDTTTETWVQVASISRPAAIAVLLAIFLPSMLAYARLSEKAQ
jgi:hypothetical protein